MEKSITNKPKPEPQAHTKSTDKTPALCESQLYTYDQEDDTPSYVLGYN
ncbi:hypothetical protein N9W21_08735 [Shewanella sp.]|nr:hypothetical protein [Shewanella sp.]